MMLEGRVFSDWENIKHNNIKLDSGYEYCFIYGLCYDRTESMFYIGQSVKPDIRFREHIKRAYKTSLRAISKKEKLVRKICLSGNNLKMRILEKVPYEDALPAEVRWIRRYFNMGLPLVNDTKRIAFWSSGSYPSIEKHEL